MSDTNEVLKFDSRGRGAKLIGELVDREVERIIDETAEEEWTTEAGREHLLGVWNAYLDVRGLGGPLRTALQDFITRVDDMIEEREGAWVVTFENGTPIHKDSNAALAKLARRPSQVKLFETPTEAMQFMMFFASHRDSSNRGQGFKYKLMKYEDIEPYMQTYTQGKEG